MHGSSRMCSRVTGAGEGQDGQSLQQVQGAKHSPCFARGLGAVGASCGQWEPPGCSQHHLQPPAHSPVLQSWAVRQPSEGSTKMLPVPQILGVVSWAVSEAVVAHTLP